MKHAYITPTVRNRLVRLMALAARGDSRQEALDATELTDKQLRNILVHYTGSAAWPAHIPASVLDIPVRECKRGAVRAKADHKVARTGISALSHDEITARIERDQAALHGPRMQHLIDEQRRYGLRRMGLLPEQMAA